MGEARLCPGSPTPVVCSGKIWRQLFPLDGCLAAGVEIRLKPGVKCSRFVGQHLHHPPTVDFALAVVARSLSLPPHAGQILFALGRTVGWIGHALEAYASDSLIRPRARYVGPDIQPTEGT